MLVIGLKINLFYFLNLKNIINKISSINISVFPVLIQENDKVILLEKKNEIAGISIIKKGVENKLRCLRISDKYQKTGLGLYLIDESLRLLECDKPVVSVAEEMMHDYSRIFINRYGLNMSHVYKGI